jgi:arylsulfatase A
MLLVPVFCGLASMSAAAEERPPNIVLIVADDLGYGEVGVYGQKKIRTPRLDKLAEDGLRFTHFYAGNAVCATSRCVLMTGLHTGHGMVRDNREIKPEGQFPLPSDSVTIAELLQDRGYATGAIGKWGLGGPGSTGDPNKQGFDLFYGYNCQRHAHNHYPTYLWRNDRKEEQPGNTAGVTGETYSHDAFEREALQYIADHAEQPFFLYLPFIIPHVALQVPDDALNEYKGKWDDPAYEGKQGYLPHAHPRAAYAAMVTRLDRTVGRILDKLAELKLDKNTLVLFTSDNGPTHGRVGGADSAFFNSAAGLRGLKGSLYEGGIRVPLIAWWPGRIKPRASTDFVCASYDLLPTLCEVAGAKTPAGMDGISLVPTLLGQGDKQRTHEFLYWEFPGYGGQQALLLEGRFKAVRQRLRQGNQAIELYDLKQDPGETKDISAAQAEVMQRVNEILRREHVPSADFPLPGIDK